MAKKAEPINIIDPEIDPIDPIPKPEPKSKQDPIIFENKIDFSEIVGEIKGLRTDLDKILKPEPKADPKPEPKADPIPEPPKSYRYGDEFDLF